MNTDKQNKGRGQIDINKDLTCSLILFNDDYHTFDYVIDALVKVCAMDTVQATQCTYLIHFKNKCEIKRGSKEMLLPIQKELIKLDLKAEIR